MSDIQGIDVSTWQPSDFHLLPASGYDFVITKATEGGADGAGHVYVDPSFTAKWQAIKAAGLIRGAYHFLRPDLGNTAIGEADAFLATVKGLLEPGDLVALDVEKGSGDLSLYVQTWLDRVSTSVGFNPMLYVNLDYLRNHGLQGHPTLSKYGLWLADWGIPASSIPDIPGWAGGVAIWQTGSAQVPGFPNPVDHDIFFGSRDQLVKYGKPGATPPVQPPVDPLADMQAKLTAAQTALTAAQFQNSALSNQVQTAQSRLARANNVIGDLQLATHKLLDYTP